MLRRRIREGEVTRVTGHVVGGAAVEVPLVGGAGVGEAVRPVGGVKHGEMIP